MYKCAKMCLKYIFGTSDSHSGTSVNMIQIQYCRGHSEACPQTRETKCA